MPNPPSQDLVAPPIGGRSAHARDRAAVQATPFEPPDETVPTRWRQPWSGGLVRVLTAVGALVVGFMLTGGLSAGRDVAEQQDARKADLLVLLEARQERNEELSAQLEDLRARVSVAEATVARDVPALTRQMSELEARAGLTRLSGPGVRVTFVDGDPSCSQRSEDCRIQDTDLQLAANTLFAIGAEAAAINGERLIATSAIRSAGGSILVNYKVLTSPYVLEAVGNPIRLRQEFDASNLASDFTIWRDTYGLGFRVETVDGVGAEPLVLPAYGGSAQLRTAQVVEPS